MLRLPHGQPLKQLVQGALVGLVLFPDLGGGDHLHDHREVSLILRRFVEQVENKRLQKRGFGAFPKGVVGVAALGRGVADQVGDELQHILVVLQISKGVVAVGEVHVDQVQHLDGIAPGFEQVSGIP